MYKYILDGHRVVHKVGFEDMHALDCTGCKYYEDLYKKQTGKAEGFPPEWLNMMFKGGQGNV